MNGNRKKRAVAAGHICLDITPVFSSGTRRAGSISELLQPGKLLQTEAAEVHAGGSVANTGLGMVALGADVKLLGKTGTDSFGALTREILNRYGAGESLIACEGETSSYTVVLAVPGIDRIFLHCPGANDTFDGTEIPDEALRDVSLFHFGYPTLMRRMREDGGINLVRLFQRVRNAGIATSLDLSNVDPESEAGREDWRAFLAGVLPLTDFFVPSFEELCFMLDRPKYEQKIREAEGGDLTEHLSLDRDIRPLADECLRLGAGAVLIKCGAPGMYLKTSERMGETGERLALDAAAWNGFAAFQKSFYIDRVLSGTGAGDTSIAAFLTSLLEGYGPGEALEHAAAAGALCCTAYDAVSGLLPLPEIRKRIDAGWRLSEEHTLLS